MLRIYDADRMELCALIPADHPKRVAADPRGMWLACGKEDGAVQLWKWDGTRGPLAHQHKTKVFCLAWSPDGHVLASGAYWTDDTIRLWHVDGRPQPVLSNKGMTECLAWRPDGRRLAAGGSGRRVRVWNPADGSLIAELPEMSAEVNGLAWSPDGARLAARLGDRADNSDLWIWDTSTWKTLADANLCVNERVNWLGWHPEGGLAAATQDGCVMLADPSTATGIARSSQLGPLNRAAWSPDGTRIVDLRGRIHQVQNGKLTEIQPPWPPADVTPIDGKASAGVQVKLGDDTITVHADGTFDGDSEVVERELMFVVEKPDGRLELLKPSEFRARVSGASGSADGPATTARSGEAPPLATAPFDAEQARQHQKAWAEYLGVPVEQEVDLGGGVKLAMVLIPPGEFLMGSTEEEQARFLEEAKAAEDEWAVDRMPTEGPQHRVRITRPFFLGKYEVTQAQWEAVMGSNPSHFTDSASHPVENVSWDDVQQFLAKVNAAGTRRVPSATGDLASSAMTFTLPTEAQWEYACRAGTTTLWHCGDDETKLPEYAWFNVNSGGKTHPVGQLLASALGLYDMHGNVWEWCADYWATDYYAKSPPNDPSGPSAGSSRVHRGGSHGGHAGRCRSAYRDDGSPDRRGNGLGFRLAAILADE
jgi:formylglycine-generating enzyme required for sulfatase activity/WD40 repeat protein